MVVPDDYEAIIQWHPEMILVSKNPVTWEGFITASCNSNVGGNIRIKLKLTVPNYPSLIDAEINFGKEITFIRNKEFNQRVKNLTNHATKVSIFLRQLQSLIVSVNIYFISHVASYNDNNNIFKQGKFINTAHIIENNEYEITNNKVKEMLQELQNVLETPSVGIKFIIFKSNYNIR